MSLYEPSIFRAYDIRGIYPEQINEDVAYAVGQAFVSVLKAKNVVVGRDVRSSGISLQAALIKGITEAGANVIEVGVISTEMLYFAAGTLDCEGGLSLTASHNPPNWNGIKLIGPGAVPLVKEGELGQIYDFVQSGQKLTSEVVGQVSQLDLLSQYITYLQKFIPTNISKLKLVINANFGANGKVVDRVVANLPLEIVRLNWNEDGTFPKGTPDPLLPKNRKEIEALVASEEADFGVAFDADADRAFFYDEKGRAIHGYYVVAILAEYFLKKQPGSGVCYDPRLTWATIAAAEKNGGTPLPTKTGHGYFKQNMRAHNAVFGGENSGHLYYGDFFGCDNGIISFLSVLDIFGQKIKEGGKVSEILDYYQKNYPSSEEINFITDRAKEIIAAAKEKYAEGTLDELDGVSMDLKDWRFNLRMSNNEPVLRLNLESTSQEGLVKQQEELVDFIQGFGATLRNDTD